MDINDDLKKYLIEQRKQQLQQRHYNLYLDKVSIEANGGDTSSVEAQMQTVDKAYEAVSQEG